VPSIVLGRAQIGKDDFRIRGAIHGKTLGILTSTRHHKAATGHRLVICRCLTCYLRTHAIPQNGIIRLRRRARPQAGIGDGLRKKKIPKEATFRNGVGLSLLAGGLEFGDGRISGTNGNADMFPKKIDMSLRDTLRPIALHLGSWPGYANAVPALWNRGR
jgi:hypothetical protein